MPKRGRGQPTRYTRKIGLEICKRIMGGESLREICSSKKMPARSTVFGWLADTKLNEKVGFLDQYERAREIQAENMAEDILTIADDGQNDWMERHDPKTGRETGWQANGEHVQRSRLRVDARKWIASKLLPKKYGDKIDLTTKGEKLPTPLLQGVVDVHRNDSSSKA